MKLRNLLAKSLVAALSLILMLGGALPQGKARASQVIQTEMSPAASFTPGVAQWRICTSGLSSSWGCGAILVRDNDGVSERSNILCDQNDPGACDDWLVGAPDALQAYPAIESAYNFFYTYFGRDGWDGAGGSWDAHINYGASRSDLKNWQPVTLHGGVGEAVFGDTMVAHDLVAREYAYDLVLHDTGLFNIFQSGALAEALAEMWGEFIDMASDLDGAANLDNDAAGVRWLIGEDVYPGLLTPQYLRNMKSPPLKFQPDSLSSAYYYKGPLENGRPLVNAGVNNKAVFLMVDGGTFNKITVGKVEWQKVAAIYYRAQGDLFPTAEYYDLYLALNRACSELIGTTPVGAATPISAADCLNVDKALRAVKMNIRSTALNGNPVTACPAGTEKGEVLFADNFDSGSLDQWTFNANKYLVHQDGVSIVLDEIVPIDNQASWTVLDGALGSDGKALYAPGIANLNVSYIVYDPGPPETWTTVRELEYADESARSASALALPAGRKIYLTFDHMFLFETTQITVSPYDGAVVEYSLDDGVTWLDAKPLFNLGFNYNGTVATSGRDPFTYNPLIKKASFVKSSLAGRVATRYNLSALGGKNVLLRWRIGYDYVSSWGWAIDNVSVHTCITKPSVPSLLTPASGAVIPDNPEGVYRPRLDWSDSTPDLSYYRVQVATDTTFAAPLYDQNTGAVSEFTLPATLDPNTTYYWRVSSYNVNDGTKGWTKPRSFRTARLRPENLSAPCGGEETKTRRPDFDWDDPNVIGPAATNYTVQVARQPDFASISVVGAYTTPSNATYFTPPVDLPANTLLYWRVKGNGLNPSQYSSEVCSFRTGNPPPVPALVSPSNNALLQPDPVTLENRPFLDWNPVTLPAGVTFERYEVQVSDDPAFSNLIVDEDILDINGHQYQIPMALDSNKVYYWRVQTVATNQDFSNWATRSFRTAILPPQTLLDPTAGENALTRRPTFAWNPVDGATGYTIQLSIYPTMGSIAYTYTVAGNTGSYTPGADLPANTTYYWHVRTNGVNGPSLFSAVESFVTGNPPSTPSLLAPANNSLQTDYTPLLDWGSATAPSGTTFDKYEVQVADNAAFAGAFSADVPGILNHAWDVNPPLDANKTYYWRVRSWNTDGHFSGWSAARYFRTALLPPEGLTPSTGETVGNLTPTLDWDDVPGAATYTIQISLYPGLSSPIININTPDATSQYVVPAGKLGYGKTYHWRVRTNGPNGPSAWSVIGWFMTP